MQRFAPHVNGLVPLALVIITLLLVVPFTPQELIRDSAGWAVTVNAGDVKMWHPHHLVYMPVNWLLLQGMRFWCVDCDAVSAGQLHSAFWAVVMALAFYYLVRAIVRQPLAGFALSLLLLVSQSVWVLALQPQAYVPLLGALSLLLAVVFGTRTRTYSLGWALTVAAIYAVAVLYHQAMVLLSLPLAWYIAVTKRPHGIAAAAIVLVVAGGLVLGLYLFATYHAMGRVTLDSFAEFVTLYAQVMADPNYFSFKHYSMDGLLTLWTSQMDVITVVPWELRGFVLFLFIVTLVAMLTWNVRQAVLAARFHRERAFLLVTIAVFWAFALWGNPTDYAWPVFIWLPILVLIAITLADLDPVIAGKKVPTRVGLAVLSLLILGVAMRNLSERILPMHLDKGKDYHRAQNMVAAVPEGCTIYETGMHVYYNLQYYFSRRAHDYWDLISAVYYGDTEKERHLRVDRAPCMVLNARYINPALDVAGKSGFELPEEWWGLVTWLFDIRETGKGEFSWREFSTVASEDRQDYIVIDKYRSAAPSSLKVFWQSLSNAGVRNNLERADMYGQWLNRTCENRTQEESSQEESLRRLCTELQK